MIDSIIRDEPEPGPSSRFMLEYVVYLPEGPPTSPRDKTLGPRGLPWSTSRDSSSSRMPRRIKEITSPSGGRSAAFEPDSSHDFWWVRLEPESRCVHHPHQGPAVPRFSCAGAADVPAEIPP